MDTRKSELIREKLEEIWATWDRVELSGLVVDLSSEDPQVLINRARRAVRNLAVLIILSIQGVPHQRHWPNSAPTLVGLLRTPSTSDQLRRILKRTWFSQTSFEGANLSYTTLDSCHIHGSNLTDSWLMFTSFADGKIDHSDFSRASGRSSTWSRARVSNCQFADAQLARADFHKSDVANSTFLGADLRDVGLTHSILANVSFFGADLRGATFEGAEVSAVDLDQAKADERMLDEEVLDSGTITSFRQLGWSLVDGVLCRSH